MRTKFGLTLVEVLASAAIVVLLVAILFPVLRSARRGGEVQASLQNLRQLHAAISMYRMEHDGEGMYGSLSDMGLPTVMDLVLRRPAGIPVTLHSPCGLNPAYSEGPMNMHYYYWPGDGGKQWEKQVRTYEENTLLYADFNCNRHDVPIFSPFYEHRGLGVRLSGELVNRTRKGMMISPEWWAK